MRVSINGGTQMDGLQRKIILIWMILGYPYFRKPPNDAKIITLTISQLVFFWSCGEICLDHTYSEGFTPWFMSKTKWWYNMRIVGISLFDGFSIRNQPAIGVLPCMEPQFIAMTVHFMVPSKPGSLCLTLHLSWLTMLSIYIYIHTHTFREEAGGSPEDSGTFSLSFCMIEFIALHREKTLLRWISLLQFKMLLLWRWCYVHNVAADAQKAGVVDVKRKKVHVHFAHGSLVDYDLFIFIKRNLKLQKRTNNSYFTNRQW